MTEKKKQAVIIGAGPAGLTAAYELVTRTDYVVTILEATDQIGGISRTVNYKGNRMDIGGHRFFSKSDRVMDWWLQFLPLEQSAQGREIELTYHNRSKKISAHFADANPKKTDKVMLVRNRLSRIFYLRKFFNYPIKLNWNTVRNLGLLRIVRIAWSYLLIRIKPIKHETSLEDFFINRFGTVLYRTFFKDYTEKVWGVPCEQIKPEWGAQRVKGLSVTKALWHALRSIVPRDAGVRQKKTETSLIDRFLYPKLGPGQLWETVAHELEARGVTLLFNHPVKTIHWSPDSVWGVESAATSDSESQHWPADLVFSTMPVKDLIAGFEPKAPIEIKSVSDGLQYRDFIAVGVLLHKMKIRPDRSNVQMVPDNWIYVQEADVKVGRIQVFNNWSPYMVNDPDKVWLGLEYFCDEGDALWMMQDQELLKLAIDELVKMGLAESEDLIDGTVVRMPKTYPAYFGSYEQFDTIRQFTDTIANLFLVGRNGMHKYNNQDHSMLTAMTAVDNLVAGLTDKGNIWAVNTEEEYHEES